MTVDLVTRRLLTLAERRDLLDTIRGLPPAAWQAPTPCTGWTVHDVVAHLVAWDDVLVHDSAAGALPALLRWSTAMARFGFSTERFNDRAVRRASKATASDLHARLAAHEPRAGGTVRWLFDRAAPGAQLAEYLVHHDDVLRAIDQSPVTPRDRLVLALDGATRLPGVHARMLLRSNRWIATDVDWAGGRGPEQRGPGLDVLRALTGRA